MVWRETLLNVVVIAKRPIISSAQVKNKKTLWSSKLIQVFCQPFWEADWPIPTTKNSLVLWYDPVIIISFSQWHKLFSSRNSEHLPCFGMWTWKTSTFTDEAFFVISDQAEFCSIYKIDCSFTIKWSILME